MNDLLANMFWSPWMFLIAALMGVGRGVTVARQQAWEEDIEEALRIANEEAEEDDA